MASSTVWAASAGARVSAISASAVAVGSWCAGAGVGVGVEELRPRAELSAAAHRARVAASRSPLNKRPAGLVQEQLATMLQAQVREQVAATLEPKLQAAVAEQ